MDNNPKQTRGKYPVWRFEVVSIDTKKNSGQLFQISSSDWLFPRKPKQPI